MEDHGWEGITVKTVDKEITSEELNKMKVDGNYNITITAGQAIIIKGISLTASSSWILTDVSSGKSYYKCVITDQMNEDKKTNSDTVFPAPNEISGSDGTISSVKPNIEVTFTNTYEPKYITVAQYIDNLYYLEATKYDANNTYMNLVEPKQTFLYKITEYELDRDGGESKATGNVFYQPLTFTSKDAKLASNETYNNNEYSYLKSRKIKVRPDCEYTIEADTNWSWKYTLQDTTLQELNETLVDKSKASKVENVKGSDESTTESKTTTTVTFYSKQSKDSTNDLNPEGDTTIITNEIRIY